MEDPSDRRTDLAFLAQLRLLNQPGGRTALPRLTRGIGSRKGGEHMSIGGWMVVSYILIGAKPVWQFICLVNGW